MKPPSFPLAVVALSLFTLQGAERAEAAGIAGEYRIVESSRPEGGGSYQGKVTIEAQGASYKVQWTLDSKESYSGPAIMSNRVLGVGYGDGLTGLAVYEIKGRTLKAKWLLPATPQQVGDYELTGAATLGGFYKFTNGVPGGLTVKSNGNGKAYDLAWTLPTGNVTGIGVRVGDMLVAVSGTGTDYGVAAYRGSDTRIEGVWAVPGQKNLGTENLVPASATGAASAPAPKEADGTSGGGAVGFSASGTEVQFAGETYRLADSSSAPGQATSELREYLRPGETFDNYSKMVALRVQNPSGTDPLTFTRNILQHVKKEYPQAVTNEIEHTGDSATMEFLLVVGADAEYNLWHYFRVPQGLASVQFVLRNKGAFAAKEKYKAEQDAHADDWVRDAKALAPQVSDALSKTVKSKGGAASKPAEPPAAGKPADDSNDALATKIQADLQTAGGIAGNFLELLKAGKLNEATALIADEGFTRMKTTKKDFLAKLQQSQKTDGKLLSFTPDRDKVDFGAEAGGIYFVLVADSKCEKTAAQETLRFFRFPDGKVKMVGYQRTGKAVTGQ